MILSAQTNVRIALLVPSIALIVVTTMVPIGLRYPSLSYISYNYSFSDFLNNFILYVPLGFALGERRLLRVLLAGLSISCAAELLQLGIVDRISSPFDILTNTCGAVAGFALAALLSRAWGYRWRWIGIDRRIGVCAIPLAILGVFALVRHETRSDFSNWSPDFNLSIGNELNGDRLWRGVVSKVEIYGYAMNPTVLQNLARERAGATRGNHGRLEQPIFEFEPNSEVPIHYGARMVSKKQEQAIYESLVKRSRLTLLVWMQTRDITQVGPARIVTYSRDGLRRNFTLGQVNAGLTFRLRTPNSGGNGSNPSVDTGPVLSPNRDTFVAATYDGRVSRLYVDGVCAGQADLGRKRPRLPWAILRRNPGSLPIREIESSIAEVFLGGLFAIGLLSAYEPGRQMRRTLVGLSGGLVIGAAIWIAGVSDPNMGLRILLESAGGGMVVGASVVGREAESCEGSATPQIAQWR